MKRIVSRPFYELAFAILGAVVILTVLPIFWPAARVIYDPVLLSVIFGLLSLAVSMILFGLIGDSNALVNAQAPYGLSVQVTGSAAGFLVFFYLLSQGLTPYSDLVIYLYKDRATLIQQGDGPVEVTLAGKVRRSDVASNGQVTFSFLPKTEDRRVLLSGSQWTIETIEPRACVSAEGLVLSNCDKVDVRVVRAKRCLASAQVVVTESSLTTTNLEIVLSSLRDELQRSMPDTPIALRFSDKLLSDAVHKTKFQINRRDGTPKNACGHLNLISDAFNRSKNKNLLFISTSCSAIYVSLASEEVSKEYSSCAK
ncbi:MAG: hypothetical protein WA173_14120 [Pseudomonas sp.]|uniref:hypothetical protein n=1 Tax=Pseudomonas sp. TaxID=306 RepID=UPI003BB7C73B